MLLIGALIGGAGGAVFRVALHCGAHEVSAAALLVVTIQTLSWAVKRTSWWARL